MPPNVENAEAREDKEAPPRLAGVLFLDAVGYSRLPTVATAGGALTQKEVQDSLSALVHTAPATAKAWESGKLVCLPTGDGMALLFEEDVFAPALAALQITEMRNKQAAATHRGTPRFGLRMGIHLGLIVRTTDINGHPGAAGEGINFAQRVMDCGDTGHILLSETYAMLLKRHEPWERYLLGAGRCRVKHDVEIDIYSLYGNPGAYPVCVGPQEMRHPFGNRFVPSKAVRSAAARVAQKDLSLPPPPPPPRPLWRVAVTVVALCVAAACAGGALLRPVVEKGGRLSVNTEQWKRLIPASAQNRRSSPPKNKNGFGSFFSFQRPQPKKVVAPSKQKPRKELPLSAPDTAQARRVRVPSLRGLSLHEAEERGAEGGFHVELSDQSEYRTGTIVRQSARKSVREGAVVYVSLYDADAAPRPEQQPGSVEGQAAPPPLTGVLVDVRHLSIEQGSNASIYEEQGSLVYPSSDFQADQSGNVAYYTTEEGAKKGRSGGNPLVVRAAAVHDSPGKWSVVVSPEDAQRIRVALEGGGGVSFLR